jgi:hypothetical protein
VNVHPAEFGTALQSRKDLAGIQPMVRVERTLDALLLCEVNLVEHGVHEVAFLDANAVLASQDAADLDA